MNIGATIVELRKEKSLRQGVLAKMAGITQASMSQIENGNTKRPSNNSLAPICKGLGISVAELHVFALDSDDYPAKHKERYEIILPAIKSLLKSIRN